MKTVLRDLVKKHFNLVDAPAVTEEEVKVEEQLSEEVVENQTEETVEETLSEEVYQKTFCLRSGKREGRKFSKRADPQSG